MLEEILRRKGTYLAATLALALLIAGGIWSHYGIDNAMRNVLRDELQTVLNADITALELWLEEQKADAEHWAEQPDVQAQVVELVRIARGDLSAAAIRQTLIDSGAMAELRESLQVFLDDDETHHTMYAITDRAGLVLAAPDNADVGVHLNAAGMADIAFAFAGRDAHLEAAPRRHLRPRSPHPPRASHDLGRYPRSRRRRPNHRRAQPGRQRRLPVHANPVRGALGYSGETYAFDENAWLLSDSRFTDQLKELGLIPNDPDARAIFNMQVRDPGVDLTTGARPSFPGAQPLTKMASLAIGTRTASTLMAIAIIAACRRSAPGAGCRNTVLASPPRSIAPKPMPRYAIR